MVRLLCHDNLGRCKTQQSCFVHAQHVGIIFFSPHEHHAAVSQASQCNRLNIFPLTQMPVWIDEKQCFSCSVRMDPFAKSLPPCQSPCCACHSVDAELLLDCRILKEMTSQKPQREGSEAVRVINQLLFWEHSDTSEENIIRPTMCVHRNVKSVFFIHTSADNFQCRHSAEFAKIATQETKFRGNLYHTRGGIKWQQMPRS